MADDDQRFPDDEPDSPRRERPRLREGPPSATGEGVRIIGAEEARAAYEEQAQERAARREAAERRTARPSRRFPLPDDADDADETEDPESTGEGGPADRPRVGGAVFGEPPSASRGQVDDRPTGPVPLPHWTEPPTGEVPLVRRGEEAPSGPQARFRGADADWEGSDLGDLAEEQEPPSRSAAFDPALGDDETFAREVEERRRQVRQARRASTRGGARAAPGRPSDPMPQAPAPPGPEETVPPPAESAPARLGEGALEPGLPEPVPAEPPGGPVERDLATAVIVGVAIAVGALLLFSLGRGPAAWLVAIVAALGAAEMYAVLRVRGYRPAAPLGLVACGGLVLASYDRGFEGFTLVLGLASITTLLWFLIRAEDARPTINAAVTLLPIAYVGVFAAFGGLLLAFPNGIGMLLGVAIVGVAYDVVGYFVGSRLGTRYVAPGISPRKTLEGLIAGILAAIVVSLVVVRAIHPWDTGSAFWLGIVVAIAAPIGDLVESMLKRDIGIKDFGSLLPGHGGVLDRFDAILFSLPPVFYLVRVLELF